MATFGGIWKFLEFGNWESGNLETPRNWLVLANFNIIGIFPTQFRPLTLIFNSEFQIANSSGIWKLKIWKFPQIGMFLPIWTYWASFSLNFSHWNWLCIQNIKLPNFSGTFPEFSGNLEISGNCLVLANFIILGIFPTQFMSLSLILKSEFQNSNFSRHFPDIFWKSGNSPEFAIFGQFQHIGHHFHLILVTEIDFALRISNFQIFLELFQNFLEIWKFPEIV